MTAPIGFSIRALAGEKLDKADVLFYGGNEYAPLDIDDGTAPDIIAIIAPAAAATPAAQQIIDAAAKPPPRPLVLIEELPPAIDYTILAARANELATENAKQPADLPASIYILLERMQGSDGSGNAPH